MSALRTRRILVLLGIVIAVAAVTLPWQMRQWNTLAEEREKTRLQEARIAELRASPSPPPAASLPPDSRIERLAALQSLADRSDSAARLLPELQKLEKEDLSPSERSQLAGVYQSLDYSDHAYAEARRAVDEAKRAGQDSPDALLRLGYLEMLLGYSQNALDRFQRAAALAPNDAPPQIAVALAYDRNHNLPAAEQALRKAVERDPNSPQAGLLLVQNLTAQEKFADAYRELGKLEKQTPTNSALPIQRAETLLAEAAKSPAKKADLLTQADNAITRCLTLDPNNVDARFLKGRIALERGDTAAARTEWEGLYAVRPEYPSLAYQLAQLYSRLGDREKAAPLLKAYREQKERTDRLNDLITAAGMAPKDIEKRRDLARWCAENGRLSRAILEYERILEQRSDDADARRERERLVNLREQQSATARPAPSR